MEFNVKIDVDLALAGILEESVAKFEEQLKEVVEYLGTETVKKWTENADIALKNSGSYRQHIQRGEVVPYETDGWSVLIKNDHPFVVMIENGFEPFSMLRMLQTSSKAKQGKNGRYIIIPFKNTPERMSAAGIDEQEYKSLSPSIWYTRGQQGPHRYKLGEKLTGMGSIGKPEDAAGNQRKYFTALNARSTRFPGGNNRTIVTTGPDNLPRYKMAATISAGWKSSPFENTYRFTQPGSNKTTEYGTFRTMSEKSAADSWIHPGLRASHIAENTATEIRQTAEDAVIKLVDSFRI